MHCFSWFVFSLHIKCNNAVYKQKQCKRRISGFTNFSEFCNYFLRILGKHNVIFVAYAAVEVCRLSKCVLTGLVDNFVNVTSLCAARLAAKSVYIAEFRHHW